MKEIQVCENCGAKMIVYKRAIRPPCVWLLTELAILDKPIKVGDIPGMHTSQYSDFHRLKLWDLIKEIEDAKYIATPLAKNWLCGRSSVPKYVWVYRKRLVSMPLGEKNKMIKISEIKDYPIDKIMVLEESLNLDEYTRTGTQFDLPGVS